MVDQDKLPPYTQIGMVALALIVTGGIYLSSHIPEHVTLAPAIILLVLSAGLVVYGFYALSRVPDFAWSRFGLVFKWTGLTYLFIAGMIEYAFLQNHLKGGPLVILTLSLLVFAIQVPGLISFTVARFALRDDVADGTAPVAAPQA